VIFVVVVWRVVVVFCVPLSLVVVVDIVEIVGGMKKELVVITPMVVVELIRVGMDMDMRRDTGMGVVVNQVVE